MGVHLAVKMAGFAIGARLFARVPRGQQGQAGHHVWVQGIIVEADAEEATFAYPSFNNEQAALQAGKHLLLEKPVALHSDQVLAWQKLALQQ